MLDETAIVAFTTFFATISPIDIAFMFSALTVNTTPAHRRRMAFRGTLIAAIILVGFALAGDWLLSSLGISLAAMRTAGGILLMLIGIEMVFARTSGGTSATDEEQAEARAKDDISVFPLATPLIAGPGTMGAVILLIGNTKGDLSLQLVVIGALLVVLLITLISLLLAAEIQKLIGITGMHVITRVFGILLCALAVQFIFDGVIESGIFGTKN